MVLFWNRSPKNKQTNKLTNYLNNTTTTIQGKNCHKEKRKSLSWSLYPSSVCWDFFASFNAGTKGRLEEEMFLSEGCLHRRPECSGESQNTHKNTSLLHAGCSPFIYIYMYVFFLLLLCLKTICFLNSSSVSHSTSSKTTTLFVFICFYLAVFSLFPHPCSFSLPLLQFTSLPCPSPQHYFLSSYTSGSNFKYFFSCLIFEIFPFTFTYSFLYVYLS